MVFNGAVATNQANYNHVEDNLQGSRLPEVMQGDGLGWEELHWVRSHPPRETWKDPHWERAVLNQVEQPGDNPCQQGSFGSTVRISSLDNLLQANVFS